MQRLSCLAILTAAFTTSLVGQEKTGDVTLKSVKFEGLKDIVRKNRGKVVLIDFWYNT